MADISIVLCTYNRSGYLRKVLESISASELLESVCWEVVIVDNNSVDDTAGVARDFAARIPERFRYIFEKRQGKSHALNRGIGESKGDVLVFVDDDVTVEASWLRNLTASLWSGEWAGAGGRTLMVEKFAPPRWLALSGPCSMLGILAAQFDLGGEPCQLKEPPFGANMAYRREMFVKYGMFRTDLGPSADRTIPRPNEDTEFGRRLLAAGERIRYEPNAVVYHPLQKERIRKDYLLDWWFDYGRALIRETPRRPDILGIQRR